MFDEYVKATEYQKHISDCKQSLTEKVKWPKKKELLGNPNLGYYYTEYDRGRDAGIDECKQSLNQASQEDREGLARMVCDLMNDWEQKKNSYAGFKSSAFNLEPGPMYVADAILKEYILVRRK